MRDLETLKKHAALFDDMGDAAGLDLQQQAVDGRLALDEISEAVLRASCNVPNGVFFRHSSQLRVEAFDEAVLLWFARRDIVPVV